MGSSAYAYLIVGLKAKRSDFLEIKKRRECGHEENSAPFCASCGKPMWSQEKEFISIIERIRDRLEEQETPFSFSFLDQDHWRSNEEADTYIGRVFTSCSYDNEESIKIPEDLDHKQVLEDLKTFLGDNFKGEFGTWLRAGFS